MDRPIHRAVRRSLRRVARLVAAERPEMYCFLRLYRIPYAKFVQAPGFRARLRREMNPESGLHLAGKHFDTSRINGAMASGEETARRMLTDR